MFSEGCLHPGNKSPIFLQVFVNSRASAREVLGSKKNREDDGFAAGVARPKESLGAPMSECLKGKRIPGARRPFCCKKSRENCSWAGVPGGLSWES